MGNSNEQKSLNATLDNTVTLLKKDQHPDLQVVREKSLEAILSKIVKAPDITDPLGFPVVLYSDDTIQFGSKALFDSPRLDPSELVFVNTDYNLDSDQLDWSMGVPISRSGSIESLSFDPKTIFFEKLDEYREYPRAETPTRSKTLAVEKNAETETVEALGLSKTDLKQETLLEVTPEIVVSEERIDREAIIQSIIKNLEQKDKLTSKNINLQNKVADYFKKKRVG